MLSLPTTDKAEIQNDSLILKADGDISYRGLKNLLTDFHVSFKEVGARTVSVDRAGFDDVVYTNKNLRNRFKNPDGISIEDSEFCWQPKDYAKEVMALRHGLDGLAEIDREEKTKAVGRVCQRIGKLATPALAATAMGIVVWQGFRLYQFGEKAINQRTEYLDSINKDQEQPESETDRQVLKEATGSAKTSSKTELKVEISEPQFKPKGPEHLPQNTESR